MIDNSDDAAGDGAMKKAATAAIALALTTPVDAQERRSVGPEVMKKRAPALAGYTDDVLFGEVWMRPDLSPRDHSMITLSVLIATAKTAQLSDHLNRGLTHGVTPEEVSGMVTHLAFYTGWPNAVSALTDDLLFADLWRHSDLSPRDRSLVTIAALAAGGDGEQLTFHIGLALENGLTEAQIAEAMTHLAIYAGWPKASAAIGVAGKVFAQRTAPDTSSGLGVEVTSLGQSPAAGSASYFTGAVVVTSPFKGTGGARLGGASVTFQPGARTNWHTDPLG